MNSGKKTISKHIYSPNTVCAKVQEFRVCVPQNQLELIQKISNLSEIYNISTKRIFN